MNAVLALENGTIFKGKAAGAEGLAAGEVVFREGEPSRAVLLIIAGEVEALKAIPGGHILLGRAGAGEIVGEMGVIEGRPRSATVRTLVPVTGELLDRDTFLLIRRLNRGTCLNSRAQVGRAASDPPI